MDTMSADREELFAEPSALQQAILMAGGTPDGISWKLATSKWRACLTRETEVDFDLDDLDDREIKAIAQAKTKNDLMQILEKVAKGLVDWADYSTDVDVWEIK
jgi:hypothetical protein